ncbi:hypothetical protein Hdeb2414_s0024g00651011 [Helianthus debilis subsp. tardiflorus]
MKSTEKAKKKSDRASKGAKLIKVPSRTGRSGYRKVKEDFHKIWPPIVNANSQFNDMNDHRCQLLMAARVKKDPKTDTYDTKKYEKTITSLIDAEIEMKLDGTYGQGKEDPITKVFGPEHGGRTRGVSSTIGYTQVKGPFFSRAMEKVEVSPSMHVGRKSQCVDASPGFLSSSCGSGASHATYPDIENLSRCELLWWLGEMSADLPIAYGLVYPSSDRYLDDDLRMHEHCVKVQVDHVLPAFMGIPVPDETCIEGKMLLMNQTLRKFIQWPRKAIKVYLVDKQIIYYFNFYYITNYYITFILIVDFGCTNSPYI